VESAPAFRETARKSLQGTALLAVPLALCCALYRRIGIQLYGQGSFGPVGENLLVLSALIFLVYFSMPLGSALVAAGRQKQWAVAQALCVVVSFGLDPLLIPWFQQRYGNGGLGVCVGAVVSEVCMVTTAIIMAPPGIVDGSVARTVGKALVAGAAMSCVAWAMHDQNQYLSAPFAVATYAVVLWAIGGVDREQLDQVRQMALRKLARGKLRQTPG
jgi:O-antigen/teichoic acid export membrane protein